MSSIKGQIGPDCLELFALESEKMLYIGYKPCLYPNINKYKTISTILGHNLYMILDEFDYESYWTQTT